MVGAMGMNQGSLVAALTDGMNECATSWIVYGPYEVSFIARTLQDSVTLLSGSRAAADGFAISQSGSYRWIFVDADGGAAAFIIPKDGSGIELRDELLALEPALSVTPCLYGNVNDEVWSTLGGAGRRAIVDANGFLSQ
jgi:hypothetical protein